MIVGLSICCFVLILWIVIWAFFAFTDEDEKDEWDKVCKIATSTPTEEQKEKAEKLRKKFHPLSFKGDKCPYCGCKIVEDGWDEHAERVVYKCQLCGETFIYL